MGAVIETRVVSPKKFSEAYHIVDEEDLAAFQIWAQENGHPIHGNEVTFMYYDKGGRLQGKKDITSLWFNCWYVLTDDEWSCYTSDDFERAFVIMDYGLEAMGEEGYEDE